MKKTFYFSHDYNAREDEKIQALVYKHGWEGYGIYWVIIEMLYQNDGYLNYDIGRLAFTLRSDEKIIESIIANFDLFEFKSESFFSKSVLKRLKERNQKSRKRQKAALTRWNKGGNTDANANTGVMQVHSKCNATESKGKESKEEKNISKKEKLKQEIITVGQDKKYNPEMLKDFFNYWTESDQRGTMRFEKEKTWETSKRLARWQNNNFTFNGRGSPLQKVNGPDGVII